MTKFASRKFIAFMYGWTSLLALYALQHGPPVPVALSLIGLLGGYIGVQWGLDRKKQSPNEH